MSISLDIFDREERWRGPVITSAALHAALAMSVVIIAFINGTPGESWGGSQSGDSAIHATPLPPAEAPKENFWPPESRGLSNPEPVKKVIEPKAIPIPDTIQKAKP